ncbi:MULTISPECIES: hypothetical protein [unclassified Variovorax]|jgi:hypothetical protein|uniref:hypothetical protein n=1 Tax=unclassified Variovorax TaxID=663243 RepID=UPI000F7DDB29|nr:MULTISPECIES: hypothetical protein [unclassified Variovorax]RSZ39933.1 hypothetical protein EJO70_18375 [Variovorax sp. 553]RSZ40361.1 hypothetical protein EJO71_15840 [Variovorax sp. 679]
MIKKTALLFAGFCWAAVATSATVTPLDRFIADREFCAYMVSLPENDSEEFLARYQAAMQAAISFVREKKKKTTETQAIFEIKAKCDAALNSMLHYK